MRSLHSLDVSAGGVEIDAHAGDVERVAGLSPEYTKGAPLIPVNSVLATPITADAPLTAP
jgi:hypothetical protein